MAFHHINRPTWQSPAHPRTTHCTTSTALHGSLLHIPGQLIAPHQPPYMAVSCTSQDNSLHHINRPTWQSPAHPRTTHCTTSTALHGSLLHIPGQLRSPLSFLFPELNNIDKFMGFLCCCTKHGMNSQPQ